MGAIERKNHSTRLVCAVKQNQYFPFGNFPLSWGSNNSTSRVAASSISIGEYIFGQDENTQLMMMTMVVVVVVLESMG